MPIMRFGRMTQQNVALVEQAAAASGRMGQQVGVLHQARVTFRLG
jgi:methyl-accepting chemotaxis protein